MQFKRYLSFACPRYYPQGGFDDFIGSFETETMAVKAVTAWLMDDANVIDCNEGWGQVVDLETGIVSSYVRRFNTDKVEVFSRS